MNNKIIDALKNKNYRWYRCYQSPYSILCYQVDGINTSASESNSSLIFICSYIPHIFDKSILRFMHRRTIKIVKSNMQHTSKL